MKWRLGVAVIVLTVGPASLVGADSAKARKKLDGDYIAFTAGELVRRVKAGDLKTVSLFLEAGMDVNSVADEGTTPLHAAAGTDGNAQMLPLLIKAGARLDALDEEGDTPLCRALGGGLTPNAMALIAAAADPKAGCKEGSPFDVAVFNGLAEIVSTLLSKGASVNGVNKHGETPVYVSVSTISSSASVTRVLLAAGGDPNLPSKRGDTPLHAAANRQTADFTKLLLDAGAKVDARDGDGQTALFLAARSDKVAILSVLLAAGADPKAADRAGVTPLKIAETTYSTHALELLRAASKH